MSILNVNFNMAGCFGGQGNDADALGVDEGIRSGVGKEVENCVSQLWNLTLGCLIKLVCLCSNADRLEEDMAKLRAAKIDTEKRVDIAEVQTPPIESLPQVKEWVGEVNQVDSRVSEFRDSFRSSMGRVRFPCLSYTAADLLKQVVQLRTKRDVFKELNGLALPPPVERVFRSGTTISREDPTLSEFLNSLRDEDEYRLVGITGKPLVGKTTFLQAVNNAHLQVGADTFDVVIWVTVPRNPDGSPDMRKIREEIGDRVGLSLRGSENPAKSLFHVLSRRRFLLLLDDVWENLSLVDIGVPHPTVENKCKVVFATRLRDVCKSMGAEKEITLDGLNDEQSWNLFHTTLEPVAREELSKNDDLLYVAKKVVALCGGLPFSLVTVGRVMASKPLPSQWRHTLRSLEESPVEIEGMETILSSLKFSYDHLRDDALRNCLLYCSLFPGGCDIDREQLVEYWIGEGFLDKVGANSSIGAARDRGHSRIGDLELAHLLASDGSDAKKHVRLPGPVHILALWLTGEGMGDGRGRFLAQAGKESVEMPGVEEWSNAKRVSLMKNKIERLPRMFPSCPYLLTLLINDNPLVFDTRTNCRNREGNPLREEHPNAVQQVHPHAADGLVLKSRSRPLKKKKIKARTLAPSSSSSSTVITTTFSSTTPANVNSSSSSLGTDSFFQFMTRLQVLDLSSTLITYLPSDVKWLVELQYLNLSYTEIESLPTGLGSLKKLRQLNLRATKHLSAIPFDIISKLEKLQTLNLYDGAYYLCCDGNPGSQSWECLEALENLEELGLNIKTPIPLQIPDEFRRFWTCTKFLTIEGMPERSSEIHPTVELKWEPDQHLHLKVLKLLNLPLSAVVVGGDPCPRQELQHLHISGCSELKGLGWALKLQCLEEIEVCNCESIEELLNEQRNDGYSSLPMLKKIHVQGLPNLRAISRSPNLEFPCLEIFQHEGCPKLEDPPLPAGAAPNLRIIKVP